MIYSVDHQVIRDSLEWMNSDGFCWFVTVVSTYGASPRPVGSICAISSQGVLSGSLSGGCVEQDLLDNLLQKKITTYPQVLTYGLSKSENERLGLPCGGQLTILLERITDQNNLNEIDKALQLRQSIQRQVNLSTGSVQLTSNVSYTQPYLSDDFFTQVYGPQFLLFLVGAGQLSQTLAMMALMMDYQVVVCDPRKEFVTNWPLEGVSAFQEMPDDCIRRLNLDERCLVITLTHDPRIDDMALLEALTRDLYFVGALGSSKTSQKRRQRLQELGLSGEQIEKLQGPVGLSIGSKTPPEIAVSILGEITRIRRQKSS